MNGYEYGGRCLKVRPATCNGLGKNTTPVMTESTERMMLMQSLSRGSPCNIVSLRNMVTPDELDDNTLEEEIKGECQKYGNIEKVLFFTEPISSDVIVYIAFTSVEGATTAISALNGRWFAKRLIVAEFAPHPPPQVAASLKNSQ